MFILPLQKRNCVTAEHVSNDIFRVNNWKDFYPLYNTESITLDNLIIQVNSKVNHQS